MLVIIAGVDTWTKRSYLGDNEQAARKQEKKKWEGEQIYLHLGRYLHLGTIRERKYFKISFKILI